MAEISSCCSLIDTESRKKLEGEEGRKYDKDKRMMSMPIFEA